MTKTQLSEMRTMAEILNPTPAERFLLRDGNGRVVMFDLSRERAEEYARYYRGARVERMA